MLSVFSELLALQNSIVSYLATQTPMPSTSNTVSLGTDGSSAIGNDAAVGDNLGINYVWGRRSYDN